MAATESRHWWFVGRRAIIRSLIETHVGQREALHILEAGCGTGGNLALLGQFGQVAAFEHDDAARQHARAATGVDVVPGSLPDGIDHIVGPFDVIGLFDVLEHVEQDRAAIRALAARLAGDGTLIATVPALPFLSSDHDRLHHHHRRYTRQQFAEVLEAGGFRVDYISYFNSLLFPAALLQRLASRIVSSTAGDGSAVPPAPLNWLLTRIFAAERWLLRWGRLPIGLSLCAVCRPAPR